MANLSVSELFSSIQGESHWAGYPCTFVRLAGCNLDCAYCDTRYARQGGAAYSISALLEAVRARGLHTVELTGGEPLFQRESLELLEELCRAGYRVLLETNGSLPLDGVPESVHVVMDLKSPGSGMVERMHWPNLALLKPSDEVKFVLTDRADYEWAVATAARNGLLGRVRISFSPCAGRLAPADLAAWLLEDRLDVRLQLQLHRILWPQRDRGV
ncbi:MAG: radical SAM protein [Deltaproteobacteria bacterium]|nr:radical SAM protein [Deltaproteobacteria bacterium]